MHSGQAHYNRVLKFWRAVETFNPPDLPSVMRGHALRYDLRPGELLPWEYGFELEPAPEGKKWKHTLYFHVLYKQKVIDHLAALSRSEEFREAVRGESFFSALTVDHMGQPGKRTYGPASFIYAIKLLRAGQDPDNLVELLNRAHRDYYKRFQIVNELGETPDQPPELNMLNWTTLEKELAEMQDLAGSDLALSIPLVCISELVGVNVLLDAPFLNSYFINDLDLLAGDLCEAGRALEVFLTERVDMGARYDLLRPLSLLPAVHPRFCSAGRWPANAAFGLYSAQQAAMHLGMAGLRQGAGLVGVNGPPGTGKTTLLREVVADIVVDRAKRLLAGNVKELFTGKRCTIADRAGYYNINTGIFGNDGIVVSSNNNTAIENISKELPAIGSIDYEGFDRPEYFTSVAMGLYGEPGWAMISAVLGKSDNRNSFINAWWFRKGPNFRLLLKEQSGNPATAGENLKRYERAAEELRALLEEYERFNMICCEYHTVLEGLEGGHLGERGRDPARLADGDDGFGGTADLVPRDFFGERGRGAGDDRAGRGEALERLRELAVVLREGYGVDAGHLPGEGWAGLPMAALHAMMPYLSQGVNRLRSEIFLCSLALHEAAILVNATYFSSNLNAWVDMVSNKHNREIDEGVANILWQSFFFCIPLVSVTLASFQRQFAKMGQGSIGWLLLDEAGQATAASACGAIWRSKRCLIIGDTRQIPPVVTIPRQLGKLLEKAYSIDDDCWSPLHGSVQFLADRVTAAGTSIAGEEGSSIWTGMPLRAHRRCCEPMFSISNALAYNGQMVRVVRDDTREFPTGASGWIHVAGKTAFDGGAISEELEIVQDLLLKLTYFPGKVFIISPFRTVAELCAERYYKKGRVECGTIHTFQGKEAEVVILLLGKEPLSVNARDWVAESPNMLNVAVTRARQRLYVVGNKELWRRHAYFDRLAEMLPAKQHFSERLL